MNEIKFWELVQNAHNQSRGDMDQKCCVIKATVASLSKNDALDFLRIFNTTMDAAYSWPLWAAAHIIGGFCSDDRFVDFRAALISRGREIFNKAVANPDLLADEQLDEDAWFYEGYLIVKACFLVRSLTSVTWPRMDFYGPRPLSSPSQ